MDLPENAIIVAAKGQVSCQLGGEAAILNMSTGLYYGLNALGARVWQLLQSPQRVAQIQSVLLEEYDVDPARCRRDLASLIENLHKQGLIEIQDGL